MQIDDKQISEIIQKVLAQVMGKPGTATASEVIAPAPAQYSFPFTLKPGKYEQCRTESHCTGSRSRRF